MSGGVDSSVAALLLAKEVCNYVYTGSLTYGCAQDYDLSAVFMRNWDTRDESGTDKGCEWEKDWEDVQRVCKVLDIPVTMVRIARHSSSSYLPQSVVRIEANAEGRPIRSLSRTSTRDRM